MSNKHNQQRHVVRPVLTAVPPAADSTAAQQADPVVESVDDDAQIVVDAVPERVYVTPKISINCRIGAVWYSFTQGVRTSVTDEIVPHLKRTGVVG